MQLENPVTSRQSEPFFRSISLGVSETFQVMVLFKNSILSLFVGHSSIQLTGPVGIAQLTGEAAQAGISPLLEFTGFLSLSVAIMNILPLPALDGGTPVFRIPGVGQARQARLAQDRGHGAFHRLRAADIALALVVTYQDIMRIVKGGG